MEKDRLSDIRERLPEEEEIYSLAELFKVFGDPTRAKIMSCLEISPMYVGEIAEILNMTLSAVSHQLRILRGAKLVKSEKKGKEVEYSLDDDHVTRIMQLGLTHVRHD